MTLSLRYSNSNFTFNSIQHSKIYNRKQELEYHVSFES